MKEIFFMLGYTSKKASCDNMQCVQEESADMLDPENSAIDNDGNILDRPETAEGEPVNGKKERSPE